VALISIARAKAESTRVAKFVTPNFPYSRIAEAKPARQLSLLKGPRQRGIVPRAQASEFEVHCAVADTFRASRNKGWRLVHVPNGEYRTEATGRKLQRMGVSPGVPDLIVIGPGKICWLELKTKYGRLTEAQEEFLNYLSSVGADVAVAWGYDEAIAVLKRWGAVRVTL
jgi:VRR-NUC domain